jgi:hypothetical protein
MNAGAVVPSPAPDATDIDVNVFYVVNDGIDALALRVLMASEKNTRVSGRKKFRIGLRV